MARLKEHIKEQLQTFILAHCHEMTIDEMAAELGFNQNTVRLHCKLLGVVPVTEADRRRFYILNHPGKTIKEYADELNVRRETVISYLNELGIDEQGPAKPRPVKPGELTPEQHGGYIKILADLVEPLDPEEKKAFAQIWYE